MLRVLAVISAMLFTSMAHGQDIEAGEQVFKKCRACHMVGVDAKNRVGPQLNGLFGRTAGTVDGYRYSNANADSGIVWSEEIFAEYIRNPRSFMPGTKMAFVGLKTGEEIANITAYLGQFQADGTVAPAN